MQGRDAKQGEMYNSDAREKNTLDWEREYQANIYEPPQLWVQPSHRSSPERYIDLLKRGGAAAWPFFCSRNEYLGKTIVGVLYEDGLSQV